jgi:hypothetical protein
VGLQTIALTNQITEIQIRVGEWPARFCAFRVECRHSTVDPREEGSMLEPTSFS